MIMGRNLPWFGGLPPAAFGVAFAGKLADIANSKGRCRLDTTIDRIDAWACSLPLPTPLRFGTFEVRTREYAAVRVSTKGGPGGRLPEPDPQGAVDVAILDVLAPALIGRDGLDIPARSADLAATLRALERDGVFGRASRCSRCACTI
jgi:hypothetical protein